MIAAELLRRIPNFASRLNERHEALIREWYERNRRVPEGERRKDLRTRAERELTSDILARLHSQDARLRGMLQTPVPPHENWTAR